MNVSEIMTPRADLVTVSLPGNRDDALEHLQTGEFSSVPVVKGEDGEIFRGLVSRESLIENPEEEQLALLLEEPPGVGPDDPVSEVAATMVQGGHRRLPVVDDSLAGIVTVTDIVRAIADGDIAGDQTVQEAATKQINTVYAETPLATAERALYFADVPYAVVLDDEGDMTGMITEVDIIEVAEVVVGEESTGNSVADDEEPWKWTGIQGVGARHMPTRNVEFPEGTVAEYMTGDVVTVARSQTVTEAAQTLLSNDVEQVPLVVGDSLAGIVTDMDLLAAV